MNEPQRVTERSFIDPATGFVTTDGINSLDMFDADKKQLFLEMYRKSPNISGISREMGFHPSCIYLHLKKDAAFKLAIDQAREEISDKLESKVAEYAEKPNHFMDRIAWLRAHRPERWNQQSKVTVQHNVEITKQLASDASSFIDAETVD